MYIIRTQVAARHLIPAACSAFLSFVRSVTEPVSLPSNMTAMTGEAHVHRTTVMEHVSDVDLPTVLIGPSAILKGCDPKY